METFAQRLERIADSLDVTTMAAVAVLMRREAQEAADRRRALVGLPRAATDPELQDLAGRIAQLDPLADGPVSYQLAWSQSGHGEPV